MITFIIGVAVGIAATLLLKKVKVWLNSANVWLDSEKHQADEKLQELDQKFKDKI